jgi:hypothetical protein
MMHVAQLFFMKRSVRDALELESFWALVSTLLVRMWKGRGVLYDDQGV